MPAPCPVCTEEEYVIENGRYFCTTCGTQSQQVVEEELEDVIDANVRSMSRVRIAKPKTKDKEGSEKKSGGRPWIVAEGLTILLREQVKAVISMGASQQLQDVVLRLWMFYLKKIEVAFCGNTTSQAVLDVLPTFNSKPIKDQVYRGRYRKHKETVEQRQALREALGDEEFYEEDDPLGACEEELIQADMFMEEKLQRENRIKLDRKISTAEYTKQERRAGRQLCLTHSLGVLYIALKYTNNLVSLSDVVRWVRLGYIPYHHGSLLLPSNMSPSMTESSMFSGVIKHRYPSEAHLKWVTANLVSLLEIDLPNPDIVLFALRYIFCLNLPAGLHAVVRVMCSIHTPRPSPVSAQIWQSHDVLAMAFVVVAAKIVFGLNDKTEVETSEFTKQVLQALGSEAENVRLFDWADWLEDQVVRDIKSPNTPEHMNEVRLVPNTSPFCRALENYVATKSTKEDSANLLRTRKNVTKLLTQMCKKCDVDVNLMPEGATEPTTDDEQPSENPAQSTQDWRHFSVPPEPVERDEFMDYTQHSIDHILDWDGFVQAVSRHCQSGSENLTHLHETEDEQDGLMGRLDKLSCTVPAAWQSYSIYECSDNMDKCHKSYMYLIQKAAVHVGDEVSLHHMTQNLELLFFGYSEGMGRLSMTMQRRKVAMRREYFAK